MTSPARPSLTPLMVATVLVLVVSVAGQVIGARQGSVGMSLFAGMAFVGAMLRVSWMLNRPWWQCATSTELGPALMDGRPMTAAQNARLLALGYAWGGASLLAVYLLSGFGGGSTVGNTAAGCSPLRRSFMYMRSGWRRGGRRCSTSG